MLIQKTTEQQTTDAKPGHFRVIAITYLPNGGVVKSAQWSNVTIVGDYKSFDEAKNIVDMKRGEDVTYYVHNESSRVLYSKNGSS